MWSQNNHSSVDQASRRKRTIGFLLAFGVVFSLLFVLHTRYTIHPVSGSSMEPTIQDGQYVLIERSQKFQRYATIAFSAPEEEGMFIKRIIGVPGDKMTIRGNMLILSLETKSKFDSTVQVRLSDQVAEQLKGKKEIPTGYYFTLGDHMDVSNDSRNFGLIKKTQVEGVLKGILPQSIKGGRPMFVLNVLAVALVVISFVILMIRLIAHYRLEQVKNLEQYPADFRRKLRILKQEETRKNTFSLLIISGLLGLALCLMMVSVFQTGNQLDLAQHQAAQVEKEVQKLKSQQNELLSKVTVRSYPDEGIGLKEAEWTKLVDKEKQKEAQPKIETELTQKLAPYFGLVQAMISVDVPSQTLTLSLLGDTENEENKEKIKNNVEAFVAEAKDIPKLTQITIEIVMTVNQKQETIYEGTFLREKDQEDFSLLETSKEKG
ncbi:signal peptidase I [Enterococcus gallinarum]|uniref:signal peptidase I n=1 Tax=Enterococcus gallinarum TaxID=1353 RepID=UPI0012E13E5B|nr:signal peptidase I [Enterococcus gallinarum]MUO33844.1 signal peptidase I [Enterococcus gallinarum]